MLNTPDHSQRDLFIEQVRRLSQQRIAPLAATLDREGRFPDEALGWFREMGLFGALVPEAYGGLGSEELLCRAVEEIARVCASTALLLAIQGVAITPILLCASEAQKQAYLPKLASGEWLGAFALTEPGAGSDAGGLATRAEKVAGGWRLTGRKCFITNGNVAQLLVVFARSDPKSERTRGMTAFMAQPGEGFSIGKLEDKMGMRGSPTAELIFDGLFVPDADVLGEVNEGFKVAMKTLDYSRPAIAAQGLGIAQGALDYAVGYMKERKQFGRPLADFQGLQFMIAETATKIEAARALLYQCIRGLDAGDMTAARWASMAKYFATETAMSATTQAVQLLGGYGYLRDHPVERMMRDAKVTEIYEGANQIQKMVIARQVVGG